MAARKAQPAVSAFDVTHTLASAKPATCGDAHTVLVTAYGDKVADRYASKGCRRLPRHEVTEAKGHKAELPRGLMTPAQRKRVAAKRAPKTTAKTGSASRPRVTKQTVLDAAAKLAAGELSASAYMSLVLAYGQRRTKNAPGGTVELAAPTA